MNRTYVNVKDLSGHAVGPEVDEALRAAAEKKGRAACNGPLTLTALGKTYSGRGIHSPMNDLELELTEQPAKQASVKSAAKTAAKKAAPKKAAPAKKSGKRK